MLHFRTLSIVVGFVLPAFLLALARADAALAAAPGGPNDLTFAKDIAPIIFKNCVSCHRTGQSGPFSLLTFADIKKHAQQIAEVTARRFMPPWLPEPGYVEFANDRSLSSLEIEKIQRWVAEGTLEGRPADSPAVPSSSAEWQLGRPDLIVQIPEPYQLQAEGRDVYRNFVVPIPSNSKRYVRGVEFRPGNYKIVHHAFINVDETRASRRLAEKEKGFNGMELPETARMPGGQLLGWQPGKQDSLSPPGLAWILNTNTDLVLQLHLHPSGKPELVQPQVGFYFTEHPPTNVAYRLRLENFKIDIPPGETNYIVEQNYVLPVDLLATRILPHAHYLGNQMQIFAILPDGTKKWLMYIRHWDFNWQGDYSYKTPIPLPKGTTLVMRYSYDNSSVNPRNPNHPPKRVRFGTESTDEMAAFSLQVLPRNAEERNKLGRDLYLKSARVSLEYNQFLIEAEPTNALAHGKAARALIALGDVPNAQKHLREAIRAKPDFDKAYYDLGSIWLQQNRLIEAEKAFQAVVHFNPGDYQAHGNLGIISMKQGRLDEAELHLRAALGLNPDDELAQKNLEVLTRMKGLQRRN